jgi:hypothetical protein
MRVARTRLRPAVCITDSDFAIASWSVFGSSGDRKDQWTTLRAGGKSGKPALMIEATHLKAHRMAACLLKKGLFPDVPTGSRPGRSRNRRLHPSPEPPATRRSRTMSSTAVAQDREPVRQAMDWRRITPGAAGVIFWPGSMSPELALLWQIYSRCCFSLICLLQYGHRCGRGRKMRSTVAWRRLDG